MQAKAVAVVLFFASVGCSDVCLESGDVVLSESGQEWIRLSGWDAYALAINPADIMTALEGGAIEPVDVGYDDATCYAWAAGSYMCAIDVCGARPVAGLPDGEIPLYAPSEECRGLRGFWEVTFGGPGGSCIALYDGLVFEVQVNPVPAGGGETG